MTHTLRADIRSALLEATGCGARSGYELTRDVSLDLDVTRGAVVAALWTLIDDGFLDMGDGAIVTRTGRAA